MTEPAQISPASGRSWSKPNSANTCRHSTEFGRNRPNLSALGPEVSVWVKPPRNWTNSAEVTQHRPDALAELGPELVESGPCLPNQSQIWMPFTCSAACAPPSFQRTFRVFFNSDVPRPEAGIGAQAHGAPQGNTCERTSTRPKGLAAKKRSNPQIASERQLAETKAKRDQQRRLRSMEDITKLAPFHRLQGLWKSSTRPQRPGIHNMQEKSRGGAAARGGDEDEDGRALVRVGVGDNGGGGSRPRLAPTGTGALRRRELPPRCRAEGGVCMPVRAIGLVAGARRRRRCRRCRRRRAPECDHPRRRREPPRRRRRRLLQPPRDRALGPP